MRIAKKMMEESRWLGESQKTLIKIRRLNPLKIIYKEDYILKFFFKVRQQRK